MGLSHTLPWLSSNKLSCWRLKGSMRSHSGTRKARQKMRSPGSLFPWKSGFCVVSGLAQSHPQNPGGIPWALSAYFHCWTTEGEIIDGSRYVHPVSIGFHQDEKAKKILEVIVQCIKEWWWKTSSGLQLSTRMLTECVHLTVKWKKKKKKANNLSLARIKTRKNICSSELVCQNTQFSILALCDVIKG